MQVSGKIPFTARDTVDRENFGVKNFSDAQRCPKIKYAKYFLQRIIKATKYLRFEKKIVPASSCSLRSKVSQRVYKKGDIVGTKNVDPDLLEAKGWPS